MHGSGLARSHLNKLNEVIIAYNKAIEINTQNSLALKNEEIALNRLKKFNF